MNWNHVRDYALERMPELSTKVGAVAAMAGATTLAATLPQVMNDAAGVAQGVIHGDIIAAVSSGISLIVGIIGMVKAEQPAR